MATWLKSIIGGIVIFALLYLVSLTMTSTGLFGMGIDDYSARLLVFIVINIILATSLNLINGFTGQFSIGHAGFMAVGAYASAFFTVSWNKCASPADVRAAMEIAPPEMLCTMQGSLSFLPDSMLLIIAIIVGAIAAAIAGLIVGIPSLRLKGDYLAIATLGFAEIIRIVILNIDSVGGATGYQVPGYADFLWIGFFAVLTVVVIHNIVHSDMGRALISIREDELAAEAMGVNVTRYKVTSFVISAAFAGIAGVLFAHYNKFLSTNDFQFIKSFEVIIMIVIGGMGSMTGAIIGAVIVTLLPELLRQLPDIAVPGLGIVKFADLRLVIFALILILTMIFRPQGLFGTREFGLSWLKRPRIAPEGTEAVGGVEGVPIAEDEKAKHLASEGDDHK